MKVAFYLENATIPDVDFTRPELGNPGCGGTEYLFATLPYYLIKFGQSACTPVLFANDTDHLPLGVTAHRVDDCYAALRAAKASGCNIFVYRPKRQTEMDMLDLMAELQMPSVLWIHVIPTSAYIRKIATNPYVRAFVCVEHEQHDTLYDTSLGKKLTYIVNGFDVDGFRSDLKNIEKDPNLVVHIGTLVPQKNFHLVAQAWPRILAAHPSARLAVIGSGDIYGTGGTLGPWGLADEAYEHKYMIPYLSGTDGRPHPSVQFLGKMGLEKKQILARAIVGIPNPTGDNENCPGTNLEMSAAGTAVVSGARYGALDTVRHGVTGLLGNGQDDLVQNVVRYLKDPDFARACGQNGITFVKERYDYQNVVHEWIDLFARIKQGRDPVQKGVKPNLFKHQKIVRLLNKPLQLTAGQMIPWPSFNEIKEVLHRVRAGARK